MSIVHLSLCQFRPSKKQTSKQDKMGKTHAKRNPCERKRQRRDMKICLWKVRDAASLALKMEGGPTRRDAGASRSEGRGATLCQAARREAWQDHD